MKIEALVALPGSSLVEKKFEQSLDLQKSSCQSSVGKMGGGQLGIEARELLKLSHLFDPERSLEDFVEIEKLDGE